MANIIEADIDVQCDDGFIAWINGKQVAQILNPADPFFNSFATGASTPALPQEVAPATSRR